ncbi:MAG: formate dehydrogenase subunit gamma [Rubrimonas sp.]
MTNMFRMLAAATLAFLVAVAAPSAEAQSPVNPTAQSVQEEALLNALRGGGDAVTGRVSIPDRNAGGLIKPDNPNWRQTHQGLIWWLTVGSVVGMVLLLTAFYVLRGRIRIESGWSGVRILRFNGFERFIHWMTASCFIILALTGLNLIVGRFVLLPLIGPEAFAAVTQLGKLGHNYLAWPFMLGLVLMLLVWIKDNIPSRHDGAWLAAGGGLIGHGHPPAPRFNAGQKIIFWSVILGGAALSLTGVLLIFPELAGTTANWQLAQLVHAGVAAVLIAVMIAHIYIGSIGMEGAFDAMGSGEVDLSWAREHHALWVQEAEAAARKRPGGPRPAAATPAE